jgi:hypothetical protein
MEKETFLKMLAFKNKIETLYNEGVDLRQISKLTYEWRNLGDNVPYMEISQTTDEGEVIRIMAAPINKQEELYAFFNEPAPGMMSLPKYSLYIDDEDKKVVFVERFKKDGKLNKIYHFK